jgi:integrase
MIIGPRPPQRPGHVGFFRAKLHLELRARALVLFDLLIDSELRGCDLLALRVDDVGPQGYAIDHTNVRQRKAGRPVRFELTEQTRVSLDVTCRRLADEPELAVTSIMSCQRDWCGVRE